MKKVKQLFKLGGEVDTNLQNYIGIFGFIFLLSLWYLFTDITGFIKPTTIPSPLAVVKSFFDLISDISSSDKNLLTNTIYSIKLNVSGYIVAIAMAIPFGFLIALFPISRHMFNKYIDAMRYIPITGLVGVFISWFGIGFEMKSNFLTFGVLVYLLPVVVQRVYETEKVHIDTVWTLGANSWQLFTKVYFPSVISKVFVDIRVITAISWTYIIVAEMTNNEGGLGSMIYLAARQGRIDIIFTLILFIILIGLLQDKFFEKLEKAIFKYKFIKK